MDELIWNRCTDGMVGRTVMPHQADTHKHKERQTGEQVTETRGKGAHNLEGGKKGGRAPTLTVRLGLDLLMLLHLYRPNC